MNMKKTIFNFGFVEVISAFFSLDIYNAGWQR